MIQTFGDFRERRDAAQDYLIIGFRPNVMPLQQRWRNNGLSADFLADYLTTFFPAYDEASAYRQAEAKDAVNYVANELLENAMKFSYAQSSYPVSIHLHLHHDDLSFYVSNGVDPQEIDKFKRFIDALLSEDIDELYIRQLEKNAEGDNEGHSQLGFLTMMSNYNAKIAWRFEATDQDSDVVTVTTMVCLTV